MHRLVRDAVLARDALAFGRSDGAARLRPAAFAVVPTVGVTRRRRAHEAPLLDFRIRALFVALATDNAQHLLAKVHVEPAVHDRVEAGGDHGEQVRDGESEQEVLVHKDEVVQVSEQVEQREWEPAEREHDGDRHEQRRVLAVPLRLLHRAVHLHRRRRVLKKQIHCQCLRLPQ